MTTVVTGIISRVEANQAVAPVTPPETSDVQTNSNQQGQCFLGKSGSDLLLSRRDGDKLIVNDVACDVPVIGPTLAPTGLAPGTLYYIYATESDGAVNALEASTTGMVVDARNGTRVKSGDTSRALVGLARVITGPAWQDTPTQRFVRSWFNRGALLLSNAFTTQRATTALSAVEINTEIRCEFVCFADDTLEAIASGLAFNSGSAYTYLGVSWDGVAPGSFGVAFGTTGSQAMDVAITTLADGYHFASLFGSVGAGTGTYGTSTGVNASLKVKVG